MFVIPEIQGDPKYVMRSSEMSLMLGAIKFYFCNSFVKALGEFCFAENPIRIGLIALKIYTQFCPAENNKIQKEFHTIIGYISKNIPDI